MAIGIDPKAILGKIKCLTASQNPTQFPRIMVSNNRKPEIASIGSLGFSRPVEGNNPSCSEKNHCSINPNQNTGMETPIKAINIAIESNHDALFQAAMIPALTPKTTAMII